MNSIPPKIKFPDRYAQFDLLLLYCLRRLHDEGVSPQRQYVFQLILDENFLDLRPEDRQPYPSNCGHGEEPRWLTVLSWAREACAINGFVERGETGVWHPTTDGLNLPKLAKRQFASGVWSVSDAYFWSPNFKAIFDPTYQPSNRDKARPAYIYDDFAPPRKLNPRRLSKEELASLL